MKFLGVFVFAVALASGLCYPTEEGGHHDHHDGRMREFLDAAVTFSRNLAKKHDPIHLPNIPQIHINWKHVNVNLTYSATNRVVEGVSNFINKTEADPRRLRGSLVGTYPLITSEGDYQIDGEVLNHTVSGKGHAKTQVTNYTVRVELELEERRHWGHVSTRIVRWDECLDIGTVTVDIQGLTVQGMTAQQVNELIEKNTVAWFNKIKRRLARFASRVAQFRMNHAMRGHSLDEVIQWLNKNAKDPQIDLSDLFHFDAEDIIALLHE